MATKWITDIFNAAAATQDGVIRRSVSDVNTYGSVADLEQEVRSRGFHLIQTGDRYVVLCHPGVLQVIC